MSSSGAGSIAAASSSSCGPISTSRTSCPSRPPMSSLRSSTGSWFARHGHSERRHPETTSVVVVTAPERPGQTGANPERHDVMPTVSAQVALAPGPACRSCVRRDGQRQRLSSGCLLVRHGAERHAVRHEAGAVVAADAYHRASGRLAVATATYGAGFTNMLTRSGRVGPGEGSDGRGGRRRADLRGAPLGCRPGRPRLRRRRSHLHRRAEPTRP